MKKDKWGQHKKEWTEFDYELDTILTEISSPGVNPDKTLAAYATDIKELIRAVV